MTAKRVARPSHRLTVAAPADDSNPVQVKAGSNDSIALICTVIVQVHHLPVSLGLLFAHFRQICGLHECQCIHRRGSTDCIFLLVLQRR